MEWVLAGTILIVIIMACFLIANLFRVRDLEATTKNLWQMIGLLEDTDNNLNNKIWRVEQKARELEESKLPKPIIREPVITLAEGPQIELEPLIDIQYLGPKFDNGHPAYQKDGVWRRANEEARNLLVQDWKKRD